MASFYEYVKEEDAWAINAWEKEGRTREEFLAAAEAIMQKIFAGLKEVEGGVSGDIAKLGFDDGTSNRHAFRNMVRWVADYANWNL